MQEIDMHSIKAQSVASRYLEPDDTAYFSRNIITSVDVRQRILVERAVLRKFVKDALCLGYMITVDDGEELAIADSRDLTKIMASVMSTDEDILHIGKTVAGQYSGHVIFIYGNDGFDVIHDYSVRIEHIVRGAMCLADKLEAQHLED